MSFPPSTPTSPNSPYSHFPEPKEGSNHPQALSRVGESASAEVRARRGVADTSRDAFHSLPVADYLQPKERAVMALFTGPQVRLSRQQIAEQAHISLCSCCGRVDSLLSAGHLEEAGRRRDPATGKSQKLLQLPRAAQASLAEEGA